MFIISLWILCSVFPIVLFFPVIFLKGLYCFHLFLETLYVMLIMWSPAPNSPYKGTLSGSTTKRPLIHVPYMLLLWILESRSLLQDQNPPSFILGKMWAHPLPDRHQKISLTHKSIHDLSLLNFFHISRNVLLLLPPYFFLLLLTVREKNRKIFTEFYIYIKGSNKFSVQGVKEDLENIKI